MPLATCLKMVVIHTRPPSASRVSGASFTAASAEGTEDGVASFTAAQGRRRWQCSGQGRARVGESAECGGSRSILRVAPARGLKRRRRGGAGL
jgi:hypothetical protein